MAGQWYQYKNWVHHHKKVVPGFNNNGKGYFVLSNKKDVTVQQDISGQLSKWNIVISMHTENWAIVFGTYSHNKVPSWNDEFLNGKYIYFFSILLHWIDIDLCYWFQKVLVTIHNDFLICLCFRISLWYILCLIVHIYTSIYASLPGR